MYIIYNRNFNVMISEVYDWGIDKGLLFYDEHKKYDKFIIAKAFVDAFMKIDISLIEPYITNPFTFSLGHDKTKEMDKIEFLKYLSDEISHLHSNGIVKATIIPTCLKPKFIYADVLVCFNSPMKGCKVKKLYIDTFLDNVYNIWMKI